MQQSAKISAVGGYVPDHILTNAMLEQMVDTNDEWIQTRTGIKERHIAKEAGIASSDLGAEAVRAMLQQADLRPEDIDMVICATVTPDNIFPDTANAIALKTGMTNAFGFDINAACCGFLYALVTGVQYIRAGVHKRVVVVGADKMSSIVDYTDRATCILFGDGAGAFLLEPCSPEVGYQECDLHSDGEGRRYLHMKAGGSAMPPSADTVEQGLHYVYQDGRPVFKRAVTEMAATVNQLLTKQGLTTEAIDHFIPHQANLRILQSVAKQLDLPIEKVLINIERYGNTTAATLPLCLRDFQDRIAPGERVVFAAFGGGFTWGSCDFIWA